MSEQKREKLQKIKEQERVQNYKEEREEKKGGYISPGKQNILELSMAKKGDKNCTITRILDILRDKKGH